MRSQIKLLLEPLSTSELTLDNLYNLSPFPLKMAKSAFITAPEGTLLVQSISHYLVHIELYEYKIHNHAVLDLEVTAPSFFMIATLEGCSVLYDEDSNIVSEVSGNSCKLIYLNAGKYQRSLLTGEHTILLLTIRPEWLKTKYGALEELTDFISSYTEGKKEAVSLPNFSIAQQIFNALRRLNSAPEGRDMDIEMHVFINDCIRRYLMKLHSKTDNAEYRGNKAKEIGQFINENFSSKIVDDEPAMARHFMVSRITLTRLAKLHFGRPLHKQVIELRMHNGLKLLLTTQKTVQEIAVIVGYDDPKYFNRAFKKRFGIAPNSLRVCVL
ncbi:helix-turn-helix transcriptional regulator [Pedobacter nyackensis]|uniref:helix-turn-helix transcriptional regulator n=1 Tax=Pedobacter nyackensis TaxID=475255 RepID=UPI002930C935|nr:helix-turn-helix transcriptional regulator [Pedobacter nyackensis]